MRDSYFSVGDKPPILGDEGFLYSNLAKIELKVRVTLNPFAESKRLFWMYKNPIHNNEIMWKEISITDFWRKND